MGWNKIVLIDDEQNLVMKFNISGGATVERLEPKPEPEPEPKPEPEPEPEPETDQDQEKTKPDTGSGIA